MLLAGLLSDCQSPAQMVLWGRSLSRGALKLLGFEKNIPCVATLSNLLRRLELKNVETQLSTLESDGKKEKITCETVYAITSLTGQRASAENLLILNRNHWSIESAPQLHKKEVYYGLNSCT
ncbi:MAG: hypothetical protein JNJ47_00385 [Alphaproteobacteria bacterium]|nr:hypothetical protein [Alphaproteobacteria bacterium]